MLEKLAEELTADTFNCGTDERAEQLAKKFPMLVTAEVLNNGIDVRDKQF